MEPSNQYRDGGTEAQVATTMGAYIARIILRCPDRHRLHCGASN